MLSLTPVTVTTCGVSQFCGVKCSVLTEGAPSAALSVSRSMNTSALGRPSRTTEKLVPPPTSVVSSPEVGTTVMPMTWLNSVRSVAL